MKDQKGSPKPRRKRENGSETFSFLMSRAKTESDYKKEELRLKARATYHPKAGNGKSTLMLTQWKQANKAMFKHFQQ